MSENLETKMKNVQEHGCCSKMEDSGDKLEERLIRRIICACPCCEEAYMLGLDDGYQYETMYVEEETRRRCSRLATKIMDDLTAAFDRYEERNRALTAQDAKMEVYLAVGRLFKKPD